MLLLIYKKICYINTQVAMKTKLKSAISFKLIEHLLADDLERFNSLMTQRLGSDIQLVNQISQHIVSGGGKRLRPIVMMLTSKAVNPDSLKHILAALIIELIHTATLLHDDVVDNSILRRGQSTANIKFGPEASVLVGDFLYSRSFQLMIDLNDSRFIKLMSDATNTIAEGEVMQLMHSHNPDLDEPTYMQVIFRKTAALFEAAARGSGLINDQNEAICDALSGYGRHLGNAFQLIDDCLDYSADTEVLGKNIGDDLAEGKMTLPLIIAKRRGTAGERNLIREALTEGNSDNLKSICLIIQSTEALNYCYEIAEAETNKAVASLSLLGRSKYKTALEHLALDSLERIR
jgi:octaprenyl-diphosphate synthase